MTNAHATQTNPVVRSTEEVGLAGTSVTAAVVLNDDRAGRALRARRCAGLTRRELVVGVGAALALAIPGVALASETAASGAASSAGEVLVEVSDTGVTVDGAPAPTSADAAASGVYVANDVVYYEDRETYDSGNAYGEGTEEDRHSAEEAAAVTVVHIATPGTYRLTGELTSGQIAVDLGGEAADDPAAIVTLVLDGLDITCPVAPAVLFYNVYECDAEASEETATSEVDTSAAGANVIVADGSTNTVTGSHIARIYKDDGTQEKLWKIDGAFHSFMSMNIDGGEQGTGRLAIAGDNEGLGSELHLTISGGNISVLGQDDAVNTSEDNVSVCTINGGSLHVMGGLGDEGDGIDSNGWLVINGGTVVAMANPRSDSGLDATCGAYVNGGTVIALGSTMDWAESDSDQVTMNLQFAAAQDAGDVIVVTDEDGTVVFAYDPSEDEVAGTQIRSYQGAVLSCANFEVGGSYHVYIGGVVSGDEVEGVYDAASVTGYEGGAQQAYTGTSVGGFGGPGGGMGMGGGPGGMGGEGFPGEPPEGMEPPSGTEGEPPELPEGVEPPSGGTGSEGAPDGEPPAMPVGDAGAVAGSMSAEAPASQGTEGGAAAPSSTSAGADGSSSADATAETIDVFYLEDKVNAFSGVTAVAE